MQFGNRDTAWVLNPLHPGQREAVLATLTDPARHFTTHTNYDAPAIWSAFGIALGQRVVDTHLLSKLVNPDERAGHGLKELCSRHLDSRLALAQQELYAPMRELAPVGSRAGDNPIRWG